MNYANSKALKERREQEDKIKKELALIRNEANNMLIDSRYKRIKSDYEKAEKLIIDYLFSFKEDDPVKFKSKVGEFLAELRIIRSLINKPIEYSREKPKPTFGFMNRFLGDYKKELEKVVER